MISNKTTKFENIVLDENDKLYLASHIVKDDNAVAENQNDSTTEQPVQQETPLQETQADVVPNAKVSELKAKFERRNSTATEQQTPQETLRSSNDISTDTSYSELNEIIENDEAFSKIMNEFNECMSRRRILLTTSWESSKQREARARINENILRQDDLSSEDSISIKREGRSNESIIREDDIPSSNGSSARTSFSDTSFQSFNSEYSFAELREQNERRTSTTEQHVQQETPKETQPDVVPNAKVSELKAKFERRISTTNEQHVQQETPKETGYVKKLREQIEARTSTANEQHVQQETPKETQPSVVPNAKVSELKAKFERRNSTTNEQHGHQAPSYVPQFEREHNFAQLKAKFENVGKLLEEIKEQEQQKSIKGQENQGRRPTGTRKKLSDKMENLSNFFNTYNKPKSI